MRHGATFWTLAWLCASFSLVRQLQAGVAPLLLADGENGGTDSGGVNTYSGLIDTINGVSTFTIGTRVYGILAAGYTGGFQIIDLSSPAGPLAVASGTHGGTDSDGNTYNMDWTRGVSTFAIGANMYAVLAASASNGFQIIDVSTPASPVVVASGVDGGFDSGNVSKYEVLNGAGGVTTFVVGRSTFAVITAKGSKDKGFQIIDVSTPASPLAVASGVSGGVDSNGVNYPMLTGVVDVRTFDIGGSEYAIFAAGTGDGFQIIDVSTPASPLAIASGANGAADANGVAYTRLNNVNAVETFVLSGSTFAMLTDGYSGGFQLLDVSSPAFTVAAGTCDDEATCGTKILDSSEPSVIGTFQIGDATYAVMAGFEQFQIIQLAPSTCPEKRPESGSVCALDTTIQSCEYDKHCCPGTDECHTTAWATCDNDPAQRHWVIAMASAPCDNSDSSNPCFGREMHACLVSNHALTPGTAFDICFEGVSGAGADRVPVAELRSGDFVLDSATSLSRVIVNEHVYSTHVSALLTLKAAGGDLVVTPDHFIAVDGGFAAAGTAGSLVSAAGEVFAIERTSITTGKVVNPLTVSGKIIVATANGAPLLATTYGGWIAETGLRYGGVLASISAANILSAVFPTSAQAFHDDVLEPLLPSKAAFSIWSKLFTATPAVFHPVAFVILDFAVAAGFAAWSLCSVGGAVLAAGVLLRSVSEDGKFNLS